MAAARAALASADPTIYPVEERVGEDILQRWILELLRPLVARWYVHRGLRAFVGADQFIYYQQFNAHARVAPDLYVLPGVAPDIIVRSWKTWETGVVPSFALEVVSQDWEKDYTEAPPRYATLGVDELVLFDPWFAERRGGVRFQRFRRSAGSFPIVDRTDDDRVASDVLGCLLRAVGAGEALRLRLALPPDGSTLFPTAEEAARGAADAERQAKEAERHAKDAERQAKEAERRAKEAERQAKDAALARIAELEAELARRRAE